MNKPVRILFLVPYPLRRAPSQRFRIELYLGFLQANGISYRIEPFLDKKTWEVLYKNGSTLQKMFGVLKGFLKRLLHVFFVVPQYDYIFIHREAAPIGPPICEFLIGRVFRKKIIYDFDDAIWIPNVGAENRFAHWVKAFWKVKYICRWSYKVAGGNEFLCKYAQNYNNKVLLLPTSVDVEGQHNQLKNQETEKITIGWTGSHSTMKYLDEVVPVLKNLTEEFKIEVLIISNKPPEFEFRGLKYISWREQSEIGDLLKLNIGIMPLEDDSWSEGKCGFKLIQYLSLGIPAVASPVGVNAKIIDQGVNGFLCSTPQEWKQSLRQLITNSNLRKELGRKGREKIVNNYSVQANSEIFLALFR